MEIETKRFEDLEFQQLEKESRQDEEKETQTQQLLREIAEYQRSLVNRKVCNLFFSFGVVGGMYQEHTKKFFVIIIGEASYPEEAVDSDYPSGPAGKRELLKGEKQSYLYAAEGEFVLKGIISVMSGIMYSQPNNIAKLSI